MIEIDQVSRWFGAILAVDDVSFTVGNGEVLGFLGPNGAGKSTTMRMATGFLRPTSGTARICGIDVHRQPTQARRRFGYLPEGAPLYPDMTPRGLLRFVGGVRGLGGRSLQRAMDKTADDTGLDGVMSQPIETLSKGYKRRVGLAAALLHDPEVLILDEPTDGLDPNQKHEVRRLIREMAPSKAIVISTHILEEVDAVCTRAIIIAGGRILADGPPAEIARKADSGRLEDAFRAITLNAAQAAA